MFFKRTPHRTFDYPPRFYDPEKDETERRKRNLRFRSNKLYRRKTKSPVIWLVIVLAIIYLIVKFSGGA